MFNTNTILTNKCILIKLPKRYIYHKFITLVLILPVSLCVFTIRVIITTNKTSPFKKSFN